MLPPFIRPMLASPAPGPFDSKDYLFEQKWDGVRCLVFVGDGRVRLQSRGLTNITAAFPELIDFNELQSGTVLDGELVIIKNTRPSLLAVQERLQLQRSDRGQRLSQVAPAIYVAFDILFLEFRPLMDQPLIQRRIALEEIFANRKIKNLVLAEAVLGQGKRLFAGVTQLGLEGIMGKYLFGPYLPGKRSRNWLKMKSYQYGLQPKEIPADS
jgi:bifunctional non-homologous end joining protein LigD